MKISGKWILLFVAIFLGSQSCKAQEPSTKIINSTKAAGKTFRPGGLLFDSNGDTINAHGGGIIYSGNTYYWFGEKRGRGASRGVNVYASKDLLNWQFKGLALSPDYTDTTADIASGCIMERPKVIYNKKTRKYVMWFHLELRGKGYAAARAGVAISDKVTGPYTYLHSFRPNGNMSRDMTLYVDDDGFAYHIYSARENYDLRLAKLSADYLSVTKEDTLLFSNHREAPAIFKTNGKYFLFTSGCTGWAPNKASLHVSNSLWGPWILMPGNPMRGPNADLTFGGQPSFVLPVAGKKDSFIFVADIWKPANLADSRYVWLPISISNESSYVQWADEWTLESGKK